LGKSLEECAVKYKGFCQKYRTQEKPVKKSRWGSKLLAGMKPPPRQLRLFWDEVDMGNEEIIGVATKFVKANCYSPNPKMF
jgi:putative transposase